MYALIIFVRTRVFLLMVHQFAGRGTILFPAIGNVTQRREPVTRAVNL